MTPKTQSVCKHCQQSFDKHGNNGACIIGDTGFLRGTTFEPVAEPASTGEPRESLSVQKRKHYMKGGHAADFVPAARPSGPSAPQTSAEHLKKCVKEGPDCDCVTVCKFNAAPQPVSEDTQKALAFHKRLYNFKAGDSFSDLKRDLMFFLLDISNKTEPSK